MGSDPCHADTSSCAGNVDAHPSIQQFAGQLGSDMNVLSIDILRTAGMCVCLHVGDTWYKHYQVGRDIILNFNLLL